jgi:hypothetical protein
LGQSFQRLNQTKKSHTSNIGHAERDHLRNKNQKIQNQDDSLKNFPSNDYSAEEFNRLKTQN